MTTARDALRTTSIFRFRPLTTNLNFLTNQNTYKMACDSNINLFVKKKCISKKGYRCKLNIGDHPMLHLDTN